VKPHTGSRQALAVAPLALLILVAALVAASAGDGASPPPAPTAIRDCQPSERRDVLRTEQAAVLRRLGRMRVLRNAKDLVALARKPYNYAFLAHEFASFRGIGLTIIDPFDTPRAGVPNLVFYAPSKKAKKTMDPHGPDFPYTLVGWGYGVPYDPGRIPALVPCMGVGDWMVHERGVHPLATGGMDVMPPTESYYGESAGTFADPPAMSPVVGFPHPRSWTAHFWLGRHGVPTSAMLDPTDPPAGMDPGVGSSFFYPEVPAQGVVRAAEASSIAPYVLNAGEGQRLKLRGSTYTIKADNAKTGGAVTVIEVDLHHGSEPPIHIHHYQVEAFYIIKGEMTFYVGGRVLPVSTGAFVFLPRGVPHGYKVNGNGVAKVLIITAPPGLEGFFRAAAAAKNPADPSIARAFGIEPVGPVPGSTGP
jgi:quercetin dioxygenase-like cupin family protein